MYLVLDSDLIGTVPYSTARHFAKNIPITISPPPLKLPTFAIDIVWGPIMHNNQGHQWLRQLIADIAQDLD